MIQHNFAHANIQVLLQCTASQSNLTLFKSSPKPLALPLLAFYEAATTSGYPSVGFTLGNFQQGVIQGCIDFLRLNGKGLQRRGMLCGVNAGGRQVWHKLQA